MAWVRGLVNRWGVGGMSLCLEASKTLGASAEGVKLSDGMKREVTVKLPQGGPKVWRRGEGNFFGILFVRWALSVYEERSTGCSSAESIEYSVRLGQRRSRRIRKSC